MKRIIRLDRIFSSERTVWWIHGTGAAVLLSALAATEFLVVMPYRTATSEEQANIARLEQFVSRGEMIRREFNKQRTNLEEKKSSQQSMRERIPNEPMEAAFLAQLAGLARSVELEVKDYRPGTVTKHPDYSELKVEIQAEGSYPSICRFLDKIPHLPRISSFTGMELSAEPEKPNYPIRLNFSTYFVPMNTDSRRAGTG
jgi:Tfp pilus assembly protein PilO